MLGINGMDQFWLLGNTVVGNRVGGVRLVYESHMHKTVVCVKTKLELPVREQRVPVENELTCCLQLSEKEGRDEFK